MRNSRLAWLRQKFKTLPCKAAVFNFMDESGIFFSELPG